MIKYGGLGPSMLVNEIGAANLVTNAKERAADKAKLSGKAKEALAKLKTTAEKDVYRKAEDAAEVLAATVLPGDPALKYLECLGEAGKTFKENEYVPLIGHHKDCERKEETDKATGEVKKTVTKCCEACKCIFPQVGEPQSLDE